MEVVVWGCLIHLSISWRPFRPICIVTDIHSLFPKWFFPTEQHSTLQINMFLCRRLWSTGWVGVCPQMKLQLQPSMSSWMLVALSELIYAAVLSRILWPFFHEHFQWEKQLHGAGDEGIVSITFDSEFQISLIRVASSSFSVFNIWLRAASLDSTSCKAQCLIASNTIPNEYSFTVGLPGTVLKQAEYPHIVGKHAKQAEVSFPWTRMNSNNEQ